MIPICLVTGFLGCGKTTLLKRIVDRYRGRRIVYLVNEFSPYDVDTQLVESDDGNVVSIPGGSIFCKCLVTQFINELRGVHERFHTPEAPVEGVVIEASGMANPKVTSDMLRETRLDRQYRLASIVTVVEPRSFLKLIHTLPNIVAQVEAADTALLNKVDLNSEEKLRETEGVLRGINPDLCIVRTVYGETDLDLFPAQPAPRELHGEYAKCRDPNYRSLTVTFKQNTDLESLKSAIMAHEEDLYRVKGFVPAGDNVYYLDYCKASLSVAPVRRCRGEPSLAVILKGQPAPETLTWLEGLSQRR